MLAAPAAVRHHYNFSVRVVPLFGEIFPWIITRLDLRLVSKRRRVAGLNGAVRKGTFTPRSQNQGRKCRSPPPSIRTLDRNQQFASHSYTCSAVFDLPLTLY